MRRICDVNEDQRYNVIIINRYITYHMWECMYAFSYMIEDIQRSVLYVLICIKKKYIPFSHREILINKINFKKSI